MDSQLADLISEYSVKAFKSVPTYDHDGDFLTFYTEDTECYSDRIDDTLTLFRHPETETIVGLKVKGVNKLLADIGPKGVVVNADGFQLGILFYSWALEKESNQHDFEILKYLQDSFGSVTATIGTMADDNYGLSGSNSELV